MTRIGYSCWPAVLVGALVLVHEAQAFVPGSGVLVSKAAAPVVRSRDGSRLTVKAGLFDGLFASDPEKEAMKEEMFRQQQEILKKRNDGKATQKYFQEVNQRRQTVANNAKERFDLSKGGKQDPMLKWVELRKKGVIGEREKYEGVETMKGVIIPTVPFGKPAYDDGVRFDLRLPYVDEGYVSEDATLGASFARLFGFGKPPKPTTLPDDAPGVLKKKGDDKGGKKK